MQMTYEDYIERYRIKLDRAINKISKYITILNEVDNFDCNELFYSGRSSPVFQEIMYDFEIDYFTLTYLEIKDFDCSHVLMDNDLFETTESVIFASKKRKASVQTMDIDGVRYEISTLALYKPVEGINF